MFIRSIVRLGLGIVVCGVGLFAASSGAASGVNDRREAMARSELRLAKLFPLPPGARWVYRSEGSTHVRAVLGQVPVGETRAVECRVKDQRESAPGSGFGVGSVGYTYYGVTDRQVREYGRAFLGDLPGASPHRPKILLEGPIEVGHEWNWTGMITQQTRQGAVPPTSELEIHYRGVIEAIDEELVVSAGTYRTVRVAIHSENKRWGTSIERYWFAPGVGIVQFGSGAVPYSLSHWSVPDAVTEASTLARAVVQRAGLDAERLRLIFDAAVTAGYESRFFSVATEPNGAGEPPVRARLLRVRGDRAEFFDPTSAEEWRRFFAEEKVRLSSHSVRAWAGRTVSVLVAERFGAEIGVEGSTLGGAILSAGAGAGSSTLTFDLDGEHPKRGRWTSGHTLTLSGGKLDQLRTMFRWHE